MKRFALLGAAGYIAPRHMKAIKETGNELAAIVDPFDSVGIVDSYFPQAEYFSDAETFEAFAEEERAAGRPLDYVAIATPNHLHGPHIRLAFRLGADAIVEKPPVLGVAELDRLRELDAAAGRRANVVLQLRLHPSLVALRERIAQSSSRFAVVLTYITGRGKWYLKSWKGDVHRSGGLAANIGIHFFDMLYWLFGRVEALEVHARSSTTVAGHLVLERADVRWLLSVDTSFIPEDLRREGKRTYRSILLDGEEIEFSGGFTDLHTRVYEAVLAGKGFGLEEAREAVRVAEMARTLPLEHKLPPHPFLG